MAQKGDDVKISQSGFAKKSILNTLPVRAKA